MGKLYCSQSHKLNKNPSTGWSASPELLATEVLEAPKTILATLLPLFKAANQNWMVMAPLLKIPHTLVAGLGNFPLSG